MALRGNGQPLIKGSRVSDLFGYFIKKLSYGRTSAAMMNVCWIVAFLIGLAFIGTSFASNALAQDCASQRDGSVVCQCSSSSVNQGQCCKGNSNPFCAPNCAACSDPTDPNCCDVAIRGYLCTCIGPLTTATGPLSYYLLAITYEPPGNASTAQYLNGTSLGSQVMVQITTAGGATAQITTPVLQESASYLYGSINGDAFQMTSNGSWGPQVTSNTDLIDHLNDKFWLWTNVDMTATMQGDNYTSSLQPPSGQLVNVLDVSVGELAGLVPLPGYKAAQLSHLTNGDKAAILRTNPFVASLSGDINPTPTLPANRFTFMKEHFQVMGPDNANDPPSGTALDTNTQDIHGYIMGYMHQVGYTDLFGTSVAFLTTASAYAGVQFQYTYQKTTQSNSGTITDAQGLLESKTTCWHQGVDLYWDGAFGTYLFMPTKAGSSDCGASPGLMGHINKPPRAGGRPSNEPASVAVTATMPDGTIWRTQSNLQGEFKFFDLPTNADKGVHISGPRAYALLIDKFEGLSEGFRVSRTKDGDVVVDVPPPQCQFSTSCPSYQNQPPQYSLSCPTNADFYSWSGKPINDTTPPSGTLLSTSSRTNIGSTAGYNNFVAACNVGTKDSCHSYSIYAAASSWCHSKTPPPPIRACTQCGAGKKCCANPNGGPGHICVSLSVPCPVLR